MGVQSLLYGYIQEAWPGVRSNGSERHLQLLINNARAIEKHNEAVLAALPAEGEWPPLNRSMFAHAPAGAPMINYKGRLIHFAAALKEVDWDLRDWLDKFELLLKQLYWERAVVHCETAYLAEHRFEWRPPREWVTRLTDGLLEPILTWDFKTSMDLVELEKLRGL